MRVFRTQPRSDQMCVAHIHDANNALKCINTKKYFSLFRVFRCRMQTGIGIACAICGSVQLKLRMRVDMAHLIVYKSVLNRQSGSPFKLQSSLCIFVHFGLRLKNSTVSLLNHLSCNIRTNSYYT